MAEGNGGTAKVVCRFFMNGLCRDGENCHFAHDVTDGTPDTVCRYYLRGTCAFGSSCKFDHVALKTSTLPDCKLSTKNSPEITPPPLEKPPVLHSHKNSNFKDQSHMVVLRKKDTSEKPKYTSSSYLAQWVNAPEFVPRDLHQRTYAEVVQPEYNVDNRPLCPYVLEGLDCDPAFCYYLHGDACDLCDKPCLHPTDLEQRKSHREECLKEIEKNMEHSFAIQRSIGKACGICMEVIMDKDPPSERRFGILEKCSHVFCLTCIRQWRQTKQFDSKNTRACPECRTLSDFVTPSKYWVDEQDEKKKIIKEYKDAMSKKPCKYFKQGQGVCPFGGACFYSHTLSDGTKVELPPPRPRRRRNQDGELRGIERVFLWDFLDLQDEVWSQLDELDWGFITDDETEDESELSDFEIFAVS